MATMARLREYLDQNSVRYMDIPHLRVYTAQEVAAATHVPGNEVAKTVILKAGNGFLMVVVPAPHNVDIDKFERVLGKPVRLASENEFRSLFPDCEVGAMPPFGNLWNVPVWISDALAKDEEIVFNAGTHTDVVRMKFADFERLVRPRVLPCSFPAVAPPHIESETGLS